MSIVKGHNRESGFTIQELVVVILIGRLLVGFSYSPYLFVAGFIHQNVTARSHREVVSHAAAFLIADIEHARAAWVSDTSIVVERHGDRLIEYQVRGGRFLRNASPIGGSDDAVWDLSATQSGVMVDFTIAARWKNDSCSASMSAGVPWSSYSALKADSTGRTL
jgi:hypothetical protein